MNTIFRKSSLMLAAPLALTLALSACNDDKTAANEPAQPKPAATETAAAPAPAAKVEDVKEAVQDDVMALTDFDYVIGDENAPVTIIEYASYTCSHCANFHTTVLPQIKKDFVETGKVKIVFRDFPFDQAGATAALLSRCVEPMRYFAFNDLLMKQQKQWAFSQNPGEGLFKLAKLAGMSQEKIDSCLANEKLLDQIIAIRKDAMDQHGFNSTPSFLINGEKVVGGGEYERFKSIIESKLD